MNLKKILIFSAIFTSMLATACNQPPDNNANSSSSAPSQSSSVSSADASSDISQADSAEDDSSEKDSSSESESEDNKLQAAANAALEAVEWPGMTEVTDETILTDYFLIEPSNFTSVLAYQCPISATIAEIIIIEAKDGNVEDAVTALEARKKKLMEQDAFYPADVDNAATSVVSSTGNYAWFVVVTDGSQTASDAISASLSE